MKALQRPWGQMHYRADGPEDGPMVIYANSLGTDLRLWDKVLPLLPAGLRHVRFDKPGHGLSDLGGEVSIASMAEDAAALIEYLGGPAVVVGLSIGGQIAQGLAAARPDLVRALVLSNTGAKLGDAAGWQARIDTVSATGTESLADAVMERWFAAPFRAGAELPLWRNMLARSSDEGYIACCHALARSDLTGTTSALRLPALVIGGSEDGASPPDIVAALAALIPNAALHIISGAGHLPCVEAPETHADLIGTFLMENALV
ncbi:MAG: 3-oxoadipate enol-lactonase [Pseudorhodobacter sp.]